ncbi:hypothetical protein JHK87_009949 [Glycine soja]|nr:hypothetical protein JHK87_009949 [Glycine soja]
MLSNKFNGKVPITLYNCIAELQIKTTLLLFLFFFITISMPFAILYKIIRARVKEIIKAFDTFGLGKSLTNEGFCKNELKL